MKARDMVENYLIGLGISLKKTYAYIPDEEYEYSSKAGKTEVVKLGKHEVKLNKIIRNTREFNWVTNIARNNFINNVTVTGDIMKSCDKVMGHSVLYFAEFVKYIANNIDIKADFAEKLMALATGAMDNAGREIDGVLSQYGKNMEDARARAAEHRADLAASALADITRVEGYHVTGYEHEGLFGDTYTIRATPITMGEDRARKRIEMASGAAAQLEAIFEEGAVDKAVEALAKVRNKLVTDFNEKLKELLGVKLDEYFEEKLFDREGNNVGENPTIYHHYLDVVNELEEDQLDDFKKATEYYRIYLLGDLKKRVEDNMFKAFTKDGVVDYNKIDYKAYVYLKKDEFGPGSNLGKRIVNYYEVDFNENVSFKENKKYCDIYDGYRDRVNKCKYLTDEEKATINKVFDDFKTKTYKNRNNNIIDFVLSAVLLVLGIYAIITSFRYMGLFSLFYDSAYLIGLGIPLFLAVSWFVISVWKKKLFKKIVQVALIVGCILVPVFLNGPIAEEAAKREGKYVIQLRVLEEDEILYLKEGEKIPLDKVEKEGYVFNGWKQGSSYVIGDKFVETSNSVYEADIYSTSENLTTVTFKLDNGQKNIVLKLPLYSGIPNVPAPEKKGYRFDGWYDEQLYKKQYSGLEVKMENPTYRALWVEE